MKIKTKKTMNLPQLIEWGFKNDITNKEFFCDGFKEKSVIFNLMGWAEFSDELSYNPQDTFTVEEEITEDTEIPILVSIGRENKNEIGINYDCRIGQFLDNEDFNYYVLNDDDTLTLIWHDGKLVE